MDGMDLMHAYLDLAQTFLDVAEITGFEQVAHRNCEKASHAYPTVVLWLQNAKPIGPEDQAIHEKLSKLKARLHTVGYAV